MQAPRWRWRRRHGDGRARLGYRRRRRPGRSPSRRATDRRGRNAKDSTTREGGTALARGTVSDGVGLKVGDISATLSPVAGNEQHRVTRPTCRSGRPQSPPRRKEEASTNARAVERTAAKERPLIGRRTELRALNFILLKTALPRTHRPHIFAPLRGAQCASPPSHPSHHCETRFCCPLHGSRMGMPATPLISQPKVSVSA